MFCFFFLMIRRPPRSTLSLHDALPISDDLRVDLAQRAVGQAELVRHVAAHVAAERVRRPSQVAQHRAALLLAEVEGQRSEEHTSELQSRQYLVCRLLLEKKQYKYKIS